MKILDSLRIDVLMDNTTDLLSSRPDYATSEMQALMEAGMSKLAGEAGCVAMHGLSFVVTAVLDGMTRTILFDSGPDEYGIRRNVANLNLDLNSVEALVLSHGHFDHANGFPAILDIISSTHGRRSVPFHAHPGAFARRALRLANGTVLPIQDVPSVASLKAAGADVHLSTTAVEICDGAFYVSGEIERTSFENGYRNHLREENGEWVPDPEVIDERFLLANVKDKGLVIFTGCSHAGIINIVTAVETLFPGMAIYGVVGGLHLSAVNEDRISDTVEQLRRHDPQRLLVGHCTGWRAFGAVIAEFGEAVVDPLAVGTRYTL